MPLTQANSPALLTSRPASARFAAMLGVLSIWAFRRHSRNSLARLAPHQLRDIGLDPHAALTEAAKPFWKD